MSLRAIAAPLALTALRLLSCRPKPGAFRSLLLHDIPPEHEASLAALLDRIGNRHGFVSPEQAARRLEQPTPDGRCPVLVTFDDGFASNLHAARTLLAPRGISALFFVCPGLIDLPVTAQRQAIAAKVFQGRVQDHDLPAHLRLMDWAEIAQLVAMGHAIGCHSAHHRRLSELEEAERRSEVADAAERMRAVLGQWPLWFAFPFGDIDSIDSRSLATIAAHFRYCRSGIRGRDAGGHPLGLHGQHVDLAASPAYQDLALEGGLDWRYEQARRRLASLTASIEPSPETASRP